MNKASIKGDKSQKDGLPTKLANQNSGCIRCYIEKGEKSDLVSDKIFQNKSSKEIFPQKEFECTRCEQDLLKIKVWDTKHSAWVKKDHPYTYYNGKLVCMKCYHEFEQIGN